MSKSIANILFINGRTRWGNEFIQSLNQKIKIVNPIDSSKNLIMEVGHGRLYWRCTQTPNLETETNEWISSFNAEDIFYDIGSNIGLYSLMASQAKNIKTYSFELDLLNCAVQHKNIFYNKLESSITLMPLALSDKDSIRNVFYKSISPGDALHSIDTVSPYISESNKNNVVHSQIVTFSLDNLIDRLDLDKPTKIKIDVDGAELTILNGLSKNIANVKELLIEVDRDNIASISNYLNRHGFDLKAEYTAHGSNLNNFNVLYANRYLIGQ